VGILPDGHVPSVVPTYPGDACPPPCGTTGQARSLTAMLLAVSTFGGFLIGLSAVLYVIFLVTLGLTSIRKGHWVMFIVGIFVPIFWLIGALMPPRLRAA
jgi:hypothetical protein